MKTAIQLFRDEEERGQFVQALTEGVAREQALILLEDRPEIKAFPKMQPVDWQPDFVVRIRDSYRPGRHPLHDKGAYYVLDFSSVFSASVMLAISTPPKRILDLCASPGGKSIFAWRLFHPELLACNETIRKRCGNLIANLRRCHIENSIVWSADPSVYAKKFPESFDLVLVDAPCSGQSLLAKGEPNPGCFAPNMIDMNVGRQRRITGNAVMCLRPGGHMFYSTCTFAIKENERIIEWLLKEYDDLEAVEIPHLSAFRSKYSEVPCYRLFPHYGLGAGAFAALIRRRGEPPAHYPSLDELTGLWRYGEDREEDKPKVQERTQNVQKRKPAPKPFVIRKRKR